VTPTGGVRARYPADPERAPLQRPGYIPAGRRTVLVMPLAPTRLHSGEIRDSLHWIYGSGSSRSWRAGSIAAHPASRVAVRVCAAIPVILSGLHHGPAIRVWPNRSARARCQRVSGKAFWNAQCHLLTPDPGDIWVTNDLRCRVSRLLRACDLRFWVELRGFEPLAPSMRMRVDEPAQRRRAFRLAGERSLSPCRHGRADLERHRASRRCAPCLCRLQAGILSGLRKGPDSVRQLAGSGQIERDTEQIR
jgi:hypothetical protein